MLLSFSKATIFNLEILIIVYINNKKYTPPNSNAVTTIAFGEITNPKLTPVVNNFNNANNANLSNTIPSTNPNPIVTTAMYIVSNTKIRAICFLVIPNTEYKPNSFTLRFIKKLYV